MLTHMPIKSGDPVVAFLIAISPGAASAGAPCYSNERGAPLTSAIFGEYNDYGAIENIDPDSEALAMSFLPLDKLKGRKGGDFKMSKTSSLEEICQDGAERGDLMVESYSGAQPVGLALAHRGAYDALAQAQGADRPRYSKESELTNLERAQQVAQSMADELKPKSSGSKANPFTDDLQPHLFRGGANRVAFAASRLNEISAVASACLDPRSREALINMSLFCDGLSRARMDWQLSPGAGSQDDSHYGQLALARCAVSMADKIERNLLAEKEEELAWERERAQAKALKGGGVATSAPKAKSGQA